MTYFQRHRQRTAQWGPTRRGGNKDSGVVVVHTYEAPAGRTWQAGASYLTTRTDHGSYHWLADALGGTGHLAPWSGETWHCRYTNPWSVGISMMTQAAAWPRLSTTQRDHLIEGAALGAARYSAWRVGTGRPPVPARRITRTQAMAKVPGFIGHGQTDPARRTDPGPAFPWDRFLDRYRALSGAPQEDDMTPQESKWLEELHRHVVRTAYVDTRLSHARDAVLTRMDAADAAISNITKALVAVSGGESLDADRLLTGIRSELEAHRDRLREDLDAALAAGVDVNVMVGYDEPDED